MLFYFNIMKCASPMVLLEFQCPTTQVWTQLLLLLLTVSSSYSVSHSLMFVTVDVFATDVYSD